MGFLSPRGLRFPPRGGAGGRGFTLIELMVVVAIVMLAMGIMVPTLLEFFKNQKLKNVRTHFVSALQLARLMAITEGSKMRVVFFQEGARVYHDRNRSFRREEEFNPEAAPGAQAGITFYLRFVPLSNEDLVKYRDWEAGQRDLHASPGTPGAGQCSVEGLLGLTFQRDGTVTWIKGENVATSLFSQDPPRDADIIVRQEGNPEVLFIDVRQTGQIRAKLSQPPETAQRS